MLLDNQEIPIYQVNLYKSGSLEPKIILERQCKNRHVIEEIARRYIEQGHADSMGAINEIYY